MFNNIFKKFQKNHSLDSSVLVDGGGVPNGSTNTNTTKNDHHSNNNDVKPMGINLQKKFARGIQYNSKLNKYYLF